MKTLSKNYTYSICEDDFTERERDFFSFINSSLSRKELSLKFSISKKTIDRHFENIYKKLNVNNRQEAVQKMCNLGILKFVEKNDFISLTKRQKEVLNLIRAGNTYKEISMLLKNDLTQKYLSVRTIESHAKDILHKYGATNKNELVELITTDENTH